MERLTTAPLASLPAPDQPMVRFQQVEKRYGKVIALDGVDLVIPRGSITGLIGPNGAGKTTSMLIMSSLLGREGGSVEVAGLDPEEDPAGVRAAMGYMPDFFGFYESLTAGEYLEFFAAAHRIPPARRPAVVADLLALVDLSEKAGVDVNALSRGMKQRLSLARALVHDPALLVLDEPASGLDPRARVQLRELVAELARLGKTVVISSHILAELEGICSHLAIIDEGRVKAQGTMDEVRGARSASRRILVRVPDDEVDAAAGVLRGDGSVGELAVERGAVRLTLGGDDGASSRLLAQLVQAGIGVSEWRVESAGLEELFLRLTREGAGE